MSKLKPPKGPAIKKYLVKGDDRWKRMKSNQGVT